VWWSRLVRAKLLHVLLLLLLLLLLLPACPHAGEDLIEAVEREVLEETGVRVKFECVIAVRQVSEADGGTPLRPSVRGLCLLVVLTRLLSLPPPPPPVNPGCCPSVRPSVRPPCSPHQAHGFAFGKSDLFFCCGCRPVGAPVELKRCVSGACAAGLVVGSRAPACLLESARPCVRAELLAAGLLLRLTSPPRHALFSLPCQIKTGA
jgi:hypothetical protein